MNKCYSVSTYLDIYIYMVTFLPKKYVKFTK